MVVDAETRADAASSQVKSKFTLSLVSMEIVFTPRCRYLVLRVVSYEGSYCKNIIMNCFLFLLVLFLPLINVITILPREANKAYVKGYFKYLRQGKGHVTET